MDKRRLERFVSHSTKGITVDNSAAVGEGLIEAADGRPPIGKGPRCMPSPELALITGEGQIARVDVVSKMWDYIKKNHLQNPEDRREILADEKLERIFGKKKVTMFEMNKHLSRHLK